MGSGPSTQQPLMKNNTKHLKANEKEIVKLMFPVYYLETTLSEEERKNAENSWNLILHEKLNSVTSSSGMNSSSNAKTPRLAYHSCVTQFYDTFYQRLFDIHPLCRKLFKHGMKAQGKFLVKMISLSLSDDNEGFQHALTKLAEVHFHRGVKAVECKFLSLLLSLLHSVILFSSSS